MSKVRVIYKSGASIDVRCDNFKVVRNALGELVRIEWEKAKPDPLHVGVDEVASVWVIKR